MRNIAVFAVLVIILLFAIPESQAGEIGFSSFSVSPIFGILIGQADEIVYPPSGFVAPVHSLLVWDIMPVFYYGIKMDYLLMPDKLNFGFFTNLSLKLGIPGYSGLMEDFDWLSKENDGLTNYSVHYNMTKELFLMNFGLGLAFPFFSNFHLKTFFDISYRRFSFFGEGGYTEYAREIGGYRSYIFAHIKDDPDITIIPPGEKVINYSQQWIVFSPGFSLMYYFVKNFYSELSFKISPLVLCADIDEHLKINDQYRDYTRWGIYLEPGIKFSWSAGKWLELSLECTWQYISGTKGITYKRSPIGTGYYFEAGQVGTGLWLLDTGFFIKINL